MSFSKEDSHLFLIHAQRQKKAISLPGLNFLGHPVTITEEV